MTDTEIKECQEWLDKLKLDDIPKGYKWQRSLMDITGIKHHENMWSDIYKFFFNEKEGHNMKDLFIRSLEQILKIEPNFLGDFKVEREYGAEKQKRIDILLKDEENHRAIIIENKVYHTLNNDLDNYYKSICREGYDDVKVVVLGLTKYKLKEGYKSITHIGLLDKVFGNIHKYLPTANSNYVYLLQEFYKNIKNHTNMIDKNETDFFFENREKVARVHDVYREIKEYITNIMTLKKDSILKEYIENQKLELKKEKTGENEEYVKYIFESNNDVMLTCFYKRILRPGDDLNPHILVVLEIQNKVKSSVENKPNQFGSILKNDFPILKESKTHGNIWRHYASLKIDIDSRSLTELPVFVKEKLDESKIIELGKRIIEETKGVK